MSAAPVHLKIFLRSLEYLQTQSSLSTEGWDYKCGPFAIATAVQWDDRVKLRSILEALASISSTTAQRRKQLFSFLSSISCFLSHYIPYCYLPFMRVPRGQQKLARTLLLLKSPATNMADIETPDVAKILLFYHVVNIQALLMRHLTFFLGPCYGWISY